MRRVEDPKGKKEKNIEQRNPELAVKEMLKPRDDRLLKRWTRREGGVVGDSEIVDD